MVERDVYSRLIVSLQKQKRTIWGTVKWKTIDCDPIERYEYYEAHQIKGRVEEVAQKLFVQYNKDQEREQAKSAMVGVYGDEEAL